MRKTSEYFAEALSALDDYSGSDLGKEGKAFFSSHNDVICSTLSLERLLHILWLCVWCCRGVDYAIERINAIHHLLSFVSRSFCSRTPRLLVLSLA